MKLVWTREAVRDLASLRDFISKDNPAAARMVVATILDFTESQLKQFPQSGREGRVFGTLELVIPKLPYIVTYRIKGGQLEILRVYHAARLWPDQM